MSRRDSTENTHLYNYISDHSYHIVKFFAIRYLLDDGLLLLLKLVLLCEDPGGLHTYGQAFLEPAMLAVPPALLVDGARLFRGTKV